MSLLSRGLRRRQTLAPAPVVSEVFAISLYTGNNSTRSITNNIDLLSNDGLVWIKGRSGATDHAWYDTVRGATKDLSSTVTRGETTESQGLTGFSSTGFTIGTLAKINTSAATYLSTTFRKAPRFFDVMTYPGTGSRQVIPHSLGIKPGWIFVKRIDAAAGGENWLMWSAANGDDKGLYPNSTAPTESGTTGIRSATETTFTLGTWYGVNGPLGTYVAYLFAHDPEGIIQCGSYTGNGSATGPTVSLGWEPQYLLIKNATGTGNWLIYDNQRDTANPRTYSLKVNTANAEVTTGLDVDFTATGFQIKTTDSNINTNSATYIYMAIKKA